MFFIVETDVQEVGRKQRTARRLCGIGGSRSRMGSIARGYGQHDLVPKSWPRRDRKLVIRCEAMGKTVQECHWLIAEVTDSESVTGPA